MIMKQIQRCIDRENKILDFLKYTNFDGDFDATRAGEIARDRKKAFQRVQEYLWLGLSNCKNTKSEFV